MVSYYYRVAYLLAVFCFVLLLFTVFICMYVFLFFATTSLVNKDLYHYHGTKLQWRLSPIARVIAFRVFGCIIKCHRCRLFTTSTLDNNKPCALQLLLLSLSLLSDVSVNFDPAGVRCSAPLNRRHELHNFDVPLSPLAG